VFFLDVVGWIGFRTFTEYFRNWFLPDNVHRTVRKLLPFLPGKSNTASVPTESKKEENPAAAVDRAGREALATAGDMLVPSAMALAAAKVLDGKGHYIKGFMDQNHMAYFADLAHELAETDRLAHESTTLGEVSGAERVKKIY